jgi:SAM-dependent methyltransferase
LLRQAEMIVNKVCDFQDLHRLERRAIAARLLATKQVLDATGLPYSSDMQDHWMRLWEYSLATLISRVDRRMKVLEAGGTGTVFSYMLAAEGCRVTTVDILEEKVCDARAMCERLSLPMRHEVMDIADLSFADEEFDAVFSICVLEHIAGDRQQQAVQHLARVLKPGGMLSLTFDYGAGSATDHPFASPDEIGRRIVEPSGLMLVGNRAFSLESRDLVQSSLVWTFGAVFLRKPGDLALPEAPDASFAPLPMLRDRT